MRTIIISLTAGALAIAIVVGGGCQSGSGFGTTVDRLVRSAGGNRDLSHAIAQGAVLAAAAAVHIIEQRQATDQERQTARQQGQEQLEPLSPQQRQQMKQRNTHVAVTVGEDKDTGQRDLMIIDPVTGETVDDQVYVVDARDPNVAGGEKIDLGGYEAIYVQ